MTQAGIIGILLIGSYLFGSVPFGLWLVKRWKGVDLRAVGSGNIGATNVGRIAGPLGYTLAFTFDVFKGLLPPLLARYFGLTTGWQVLAALCGVIGHNYSVFLGFAGGKGIATSLGALVGVAPLVGIGALSVFLIEFLTLRWVSLGSILAALSLPLLALWLYPAQPAILAFACAACAMAVYKHRANIQRLRTGTEPKVRLPWNKSAGIEAGIANEAIVKSELTVKNEVSAKNEVLSKSEASVKNEG